MDRRPALALVTVAAGLVLGAACGDDGGGDLDAFCATARGMVTDNPALVFDRIDPADPTAAAAMLRDGGHRLQQWADQAPGGIDGDVGTIAAAAFSIADGFEAPEPGPDRAEELRSRFEEVEAASARVTEYVRTQCAVELDPGATAATVPGASSSSSTTTP